MCFPVPNILWKTATPFCRPTSEMWYKACPLLFSAHLYLVIASECIIIFKTLPRSFMKISMHHIFPCLLILCCGYAMIRKASAHFFIFSAVANLYLLINFYSVVDPVYGTERYPNRESVIFGRTPVIALSAFIRHNQSVVSDIARKSLVPPFDPKERSIQPDLEHLETMKQMSGFISPKDVLKDDLDAQDELAFESVPTREGDSGSIQSSLPRLNWDTHEEFCSIGLHMLNASDAERPAEADREPSMKLLHKLWMIYLFETHIWGIVVNEGEYSRTSHYDAYYEYAVSLQQNYGFKNRDFVPSCLHPLFHENHYGSKYIEYLIDIGLVPTARRVEIESLARTSQLCTCFSAFIVSLIIGLRLQRQLNERLAQYHASRLDDDIQDDFQNREEMLRRRDNFPQSVNPYEHRYTGQGAAFIGDGMKLDDFMDAS
eukprot:GHVH01000042.1.p1 GENE.GHVH01000042.1~~GHVH01000042.1.p1  ORF type:complete len:431 (-),score=35.24 GHVH01000042.1:80-1372(-)